MKWWQISLLLCCFGFLKDFRPAEPFLSHYLTGPWKNFTKSEVNQYVYPINTYSYLACTIFVLLLTDLVRSAYTNVHVIKWSAWWAFATCGYLQVASYMQLIWIDIAQDGEKIYNGAVDAVYKIIGAIAVFIVSKAPLNWPLLGEAVLSVFSILEGVLVIFSSITSTLWVSYICFVAFEVIYHTIITIANFEVAKYINNDSFGLIFGINTFLTLVLQSVLTIIVVDGPLKLDIRKQFFIYGGYFLILGILFMIMGILTIAMSYRKGERFRFFTTVEDNKRKPEV